MGLPVLRRVGDMNLRCEACGLPGSVWVRLYDAYGVRSYHEVCYGQVKPVPRALGWTR